MKLRQAKKILKMSCKPGSKYNKDIFFSLLTVKYPPFLIENANTRCRRYQNYKYGRLCLNVRKEIQMMATYIEDIALTYPREIPLYPNKLQIPKHLCK